MFRLISCSNTFQILLLFVQGQGQKGKQKHIKKTFVRSHNFTMGWIRRGGARLTIINVASDNGYQPFQFGGLSLPYPVYSVGNFIQVIFTSQAYQYSGFNASYTAITYDSGKLP